MIKIRQLDIARELSSSRVSFSKALRDHPDKSVAMKKKIIEVANRMGYVPDLISHKLNSYMTFPIDIVVPDLENSFFSHITNKINNYAIEHNYSVIHSLSREKEKQEKQYKVAYFEKFNWK